MGNKKEDLSTSKESIYGFTNTAALIAGIIDLKTSIGSKKDGVNQTIDSLLWRWGRISTPCMNNHSSKESRLSLPPTLSAWDI